MEQKDFLIGLKYLSEAFSKDFTENESKIWYENLKIYEFNVFRESLKNIVKEFKFFPKIADVIELCETTKGKIRCEVLQKMREDDYFRYGINGIELNERQQNSNYDKAVNYILNDIMPKWLKEDIEKYQKKFLNNTDRKLIGGE